MSMEKVGDTGSHEGANSKDQNVLVTHTDRTGKKRMRIMTIKKPDTRPGFKTRPQYFSETFNIFVVWRGLLVEFVATGLFTFFACGSVAASVPYGVQTAAANILAAVVQGYAIAMLVYAIAHTSGGHINPAVTASLIVSGHVGILRGITYIISQMVGAITGAAILRGVLPEDIIIQLNNLGTTVLSPGTSQGQGFWFEFMMTFALLFTIYGTAINTESAVNGSHVLAPLPIGFAVTVGVGIAYGFTGGSLNPARTFGPAVISGTFQHQWVYWAGPLTASFVMGIFQRYVLLVEYDHSDKNKKNKKKQITKTAQEGVSTVSQKHTDSDQQAASRRQSTISLDDINAGASSEEEEDPKNNRSRMHRYKYPTSDHSDQEMSSSQVSNYKYPSSNRASVVDIRDSQQSHHRPGRYDDRRQSVTEVTPYLPQPPSRRGDPPSASSARHERRESTVEITPLSGDYGDKDLNSQISRFDRSSLHRRGHHHHFHGRSPSPQSPPSYSRSGSLSNSTYDLRDSVSISRPPSPPAVSRPVSPTASRPVSPTAASYDRRDSVSISRPSSPPTRSDRSGHIPKPPPSGNSRRSSIINSQSDLKDSDVFHVPRLSLAQSTASSLLQQSQAMRRSSTLYGPPIPEEETFSIYDPPPSTPSASAFPTPIGSPAESRREDDPRSSATLLASSAASEIARSALIERSPVTRRRHHRRRPSTPILTRRAAREASPNPLSRSTDIIIPLDTIEDRPGGGFAFGFADDWENYL